MAPLTRPTLPAWNLTPFTVTDPSPALVTALTPRLLRTDSQQAGRGRGYLNFKNEFCVEMKGSLQELFVQCCEH